MRPGQLPAKLRRKYHDLTRTMKGCDRFWVSFDEDGYPDDVHKISAFSPEEYGKGAWQRWKDGWEEIDEA